jgi:hypothetical protein
MECAHSSVYQVVVKAVPLDYAGDAVALVPPKHNYRRPIIGSAQSWRRRLGRLLSPQLKQHIRKALNLLGIKA